MKLPLSAPLWLSLLALGASCAQGSSELGGSELTALDGDAGNAGSQGGGSSGGDAGNGGTLPEVDSGGNVGPSGSSSGVDPSASSSGSSSGSVGWGSSGAGSSSSGAWSGSSGAGSSGSGSGSWNGSSSGTGSSGSGSGVVPTDCTAANGVQGCCVGNTVYYCKAGSSTLTVKSCTSGQVCGWESSKSYYYCVSPPASADPSGMYSLACQ